MQKTVRCVVVALSFWMLNQSGAAHAAPPSFGSGGGGASQPTGTLNWVTPAIEGVNLHYQTFDSAVVGSKVSYHLYLPDAYNKNPNQRFPVLYWLHGSAGGLKGLPLLSAYFDEAIRAGKIPPMIIVFPNGLMGSMWCDAKDGSVPMETVVMKELLPLIDANFRTITSRQGRIVEGFSMGGYGAARLGIKYPDVFSAISILAGGPLQPEFSVEIGPRDKAALRGKLMQSVYGGDQAYFRAQSPWLLAEQNAAAVRGRVRIRQAIGGIDGTLPFNKAFDERLTALNIPHSFTVVPGVDHDTMGLLGGLGEANWEFYRSVFGQ
jgi:enterochelin esterase-like enzyme